MKVLEVDSIVEPEGLTFPSKKHFACKFKILRYQYKDTDEYLRVKGIPLLSTGAVSTPVGYVSRQTRPMNLAFVDLDEDMLSRHELNRTYDANNRKKPLKSVDSNFSSNKKPRNISNENPKYQQNHNNKSQSNDYKRNSDNEYGKTLPNNLPVNEYDNNDKKFKSPRSKRNNSQNHKPNKEDYEMDMDKDTNVEVHHHHVHYHESPSKEVDERSYSPPVRWP